MESVAFFEEKVPLTARDFAQERINIDNLLREKLKQKLEGKCSLHGWVVPRTVKILSRSMGYVESGRFTGDIVFHVQVQGTVINPPSGITVVGQVIRKNKMGMYVDYENAIRIILPRDLHIGDQAYEDVNVGQYVECVIKKSRFQVNDPYILSVGVFMKSVGKVPKKENTSMPSLENASSMPALAEVEEEAEEEGAEAEGAEEEGAEEAASAGFDPDDQEGVD